MKTVEREALAKKNATYVQNHFSDERLDLIWKQIFQKVSMLKTINFIKLLFRIFDCAK